MNNSNFPQTILLFYEDSMSFITNHGQIFKRKENYKLIILMNTDYKKHQNMSKLNPVVHKNVKYDKVI